MIPGLTTLNNNLYAVGGYNPADFCAPLSSVEKARERPQASIFARVWRWLAARADDGDEELSSPGE